MDATNKIIDFIEARTSEEYRVDPYYMFEPFSVKERSLKDIEQSQKDHVDLHAPELTNIIGKDPHPFQDGYCLDTEFLCMLLAGSQTGKSYNALIDDIIMLTGEIPFSLRHDKGTKTGIKRVVNDENIRRFGRIDKKTGEVIDYVTTADQDLTWNCGEIIGVGKYPKEKIAAPGSKIWLCTYKQARDEYWWPRFKTLIPDHLINRRKGNDGFYSSDGFIVYLTRNCEIHIITYEQGFERVEAEKVHCIHLDEEPNDERFFTAALTHCSLLRMTMTPYRGLTFTHDKIFKQSGKNAAKIYHCTQYDSPYHTLKHINRMRKFMKPWEIGARVYGLHSEQVGKPYYDRVVVTNKIRSEYLFKGEYKNIMPARPWDNVGELFSCDIFAEEADGEENCWIVYEAPKDECTYWMSVDTAVGSADAEMIADKNCAHVFRLPIGGENPNRPVHVATLHTGMEVAEFARLTLYGALYYNNALLAPEINGQSAGTYLSEVKDYPFLFTMAVMNDKTKKPTEKIGFTTSVRTRIMLFDLVGNWIKEYEDLPHYGINHLYTLKEIAGCVVGKKGRPDHPRGGSTDCIIAFGIGLYVFQKEREQIQNRFMYNKSKKRLDMWADRVYDSRETRPILGGRGLDARENTKNLGFFKR